jgi:ABC-2 type transport system ATP-binding protein
MDFTSLIFTDVSRSYGRRWALNRVSLRCDAGEIVALLGPNGAGKSTLLSVAASLLSPSAGRVRYGEHELHATPALRQRIGLVGHDLYLYPDLTAAENLTFYGRLHRVADVGRRVDAALERAHLSSRRDDAVHGFSRGMRQRLTLERALLHDPRLVLLDEPTNGLDPSSRDDMLALVRRIGTEFGIAVLVTSHLLGELERVSDHVVVLDSGRLLRSSATTDFLHKTGNLLVEGQGRPDADRLLGQALVDAGLRAWPTDGRMIEVEARDESTRDVVRDLAVELGLGLVRMQERHHRIEDVFREGGAGSVQPV